jgi:hypothetical protein
MATFESKSRYVNYATTYVIDDGKGSSVQVLGAATVPAQDELGEHLRRQGQRLDHLAGFYLAHPTGFWRICEHNNAMLPDSLAEAERIKIPTPT